MKVKSVKQGRIQSNLDEEQDYFDSLIRLDRLLYKPTVTGNRLHLSLARTRVMRGGLGCVEEGTLIDTVNGKVAVGDIKGPMEYASFDLARNERCYRLGSISFPKGRERLYRLCHEHGELTCAGHHLVLCADGKYRRVEELKAGDALIYSDAYSLPEASFYQRLTSQESFQKGLPEDALRSSGIDEGFLERYSACFRQRDQQPLLAGDSAQVFSPSPGDAEELSRSFLREGDRLAPEQECIHRDQSSYLRSMPGSVPHSEGLAEVAGDFLEALASGRISQGIQRCLQSLHLSSSHHKANESDHDCICGSSLTINKTAVLCIEKSQTDWYWDLQVPGTNNYSAHGLIHHNSGKTRCATEHINNMAMRYPRSTYLIGRKDMTSLKETTQKEFLEKVVDSATVEAFNVNDNKLTYKNGSEILFRETKEPDKVKSLELAGYLLDECDENNTDEIWQKIDDRLRQKILLDGKLVIPPYCGLLVFNPTNEDHWLYQVSIRKDIDVEDFQFSTYENADNLPPDYIPNLLRKLPPWEVDRLVYGNWGRAVHGLPVYHGFTREGNVRALKVNPEFPLLRGWDFGYGHPAVVFCQIDHTTNRLYILREYFGTNQKLEDVVAQVNRITNELVGATYYPTFDYGDPHGADEKDVGESSIEYLRIHHGIHVIHRRERIKTGMEELQHKISTLGPMYAPSPGKDPPPQASLLLVDPTCRVTITAFEGGYHRDETGVPVKDGKYDHIPDAIRYLVVNTMNRGLQSKFQKRRYRPGNKYTGY